MRQWVRSPRAEWQVGCLFPIAALLAAAVAIGLLIGTDLGQSRVSRPDHVVVRVIDDGAAGGPAVLTTAIVPLR